MKILIIRNYPSYMSVDNNTYNIQEVGLAKALVRRGHICDIVFWTDKDEETKIIPVDDYGVVHAFYRHGKTLLKNTVFTQCTSLFDKYDILQPAEYNQIQSWILAKKYPQKTIIYHGPYYSPFNKRYNLMCKVFDLLCLNQYIRKKTKFLVKSRMAKELLTRKGIKSVDVKVVGVGIDSQMLSANDEEICEPLFKAIERQEKGIKLLYIGRFEKRRNIPFIIDVFEKVLEKKPDARLYMIGTGNPDYLKMSFDYMVKRGLRKKIVWQEKMEQKYLSSIYKKVDFFLLPTEYEIFGMVLLESMYYGNVVLTTLNGGSSTLIQSGKNGFILDKEPEEWAKCVVDLSDERKLKISKEATNTIMKNNTWDRLAPTFEREYSNVINNI